MLEAKVKSCDRVFDILELFSQLRRPLRLKEIAGGLRLPTSSTAALTKSMTARLYLRYDPQARTYCPTARLGFLTNWVAPGDPFEEVTVRAAMQQVQQATNELIVLGIERDLYLEYIETLRSEGGTQLYAPPGTRRILVLTAGWLMLQDRSREEAVRIYRRSVSSGMIERERLSESDFLKHLEQHAGAEVCHTRARDFRTPTAHWDGAMIYSLLPVPDGRRRLVIGVGGPAERIEAKRDSIMQALAECRRNLHERVKNAQ